jgi:adenylate cyclase
MQRNRRSRLIFLVLIALVIAAYYLPVSGNVYRVLQLKLYDVFWHSASALGDWDKLPLIEEVCIVDIGEQSIAELGQFSSWPSLFFADLVDIVAQDSPKLIAFDIFFSESDSLSEFSRQRLAQHFQRQGIEDGKLIPALSTDSELERALRQAGNVYLPMFGTNQQADHLVLLPQTLKTWDVQPDNYKELNHLYPPVHYLANAAKGIGLAHISVDESGSIHDFPLFFSYEKQYLVNFSFQACLDLLEVDQIQTGANISLLRAGKTLRTMPLDDRGRFHFRHYGAAERFRYIQISDVLKGNVEPGFFRDKIVLIGASAAGLRDTKPSPLSMDIPGVELHATFIYNLLHEEYVHWLPSWLGWVLALILLFLASKLLKRCKPVSGLLVFLLTTYGLLLGLYLLFATSFYAMPYSTLFFPWVIGFSALMIGESQRQHHEKQKVKHAFEHYVSKAVIREVMQTPQALKVGGVKRHACIMFADIRDFSTMCESMSPDAVSGFLHDYFNRSTALITRHNGMLDKYIGDAILALFNVPVDQKDYQYQACLCALELISEVQSIRRQNIGHQLLANLRVGIGLASGSIIAGNLGSDEIFNYSGIGDRMNLASRLESLNKFYLTQIIVDNETWLVTREHFHYRWLDRVCVKGKQEAVDIYELLGSKNDPLPHPDAIKLYEEALAALCKPDPDHAEQLFLKASELAPDDPPTLIMLQRLKELNRTAWDGVYRHILK